MYAYDPWGSMKMAVRVREYRNFGFPFFVGNFSFAGSLHAYMMPGIDSCVRLPSQLPSKYRGALLTYLAVQVVGDTHIHGVCCGYLYAVCWRSFFHVRAKTSTGFGTFLRTKFETDPIFFVTFLYSFT